MGVNVGEVYYIGEDVLNKEEIGNIITLKHTYLAKEFELPILENTMPNLVLRLQILNFVFVGNFSGGYKLKDRIFERMDNIL
ncbi:hypothetical protein [Capnocytophaga granulosa]|jgi:hypothetical protein